MSSAVNPERSPSLLCSCYPKNESVKCSSIKKMEEMLCSFFHLQTKVGGQVGRLDVFVLWCAATSYSIFYFFCGTCLTRTWLNYTEEYLELSLIKCSIIKKKQEKFFFLNFFKKTIRQRSILARHNKSTYATRLPQRESERERERWRIVGGLCDNKECVCSYMCCYFSFLIFIS